MKPTICEDRTPGFPPRVWIDWHGPRPETVEVEAELLEELVEAIYLRAGARP